MSFTKIQSYLLFLFLVSVTFIITPQTRSQKIIIEMGSIQDRLGEKQVPLDVYLTNLNDSIVAFNLWWQLDRPDLCRFSSEYTTNYDTTFYECLQWSGSTCIDSVEALNSGYDFFYVDSFEIERPLFDVSESVIADWRYMDTRSISATFYDINVVGICNLPGLPDGTPIESSANKKLLFRLFIDVEDSLTFPISDSTVNILLNEQFTDHFSMINTHGENVFVKDSMIEVTDTTCYECTDWIHVSPDSICISYQIIPSGNECDSISVEVDTTLQYLQDYYEIINGVFTLSSSCGYNSGTFDISNLVSLVDFMFASGPPLSIEEADCNCDCLIDVADLVCFVDYMFGSGSSPGCE